MTIGWEGVVTLIGAAGGGAILTKMADWLLSRRSRRVNDTVKISDVYSKLLDELQEERRTLQGEVAHLRAWKVKAEGQIADLLRKVKERDGQLSALVRENEVLKVGYAEVREECDSLQARVHKLEIGGDGEA